MVILYDLRQGGFDAISSSNDRSTYLFLKCSRKSED